jgi:hypothetical protein
MEDLIAEFPNEFLQGHNLVLKGRQRSFAGVGRFDLLFLDSYQTNVLMELKARTAKYEDATQLAKYKEALEQLREGKILMWLVATQIPNSVREFMDRIGIEYSEIHEAQFKRVAGRHGIELSEEPPLAVPIYHTKVARTAHLPGPAWYESPYALKPNIEKSEVEQLIKRFESSVRRQIDRSLSQKLRQELLDSDPPYISRATTLQLAKWCNTNNPLYWDGMDVARKLSHLLFGCVLDRQKLRV